MLGVVTNPTTTPSDLEMKRLAEQFGKADTFHPTPVGVFFGRDGAQEPGATVPDPFFGGAGPERTGCIQCGECMTGCRHGAKNTLTTNYLFLAERNGAEIHPLTTVTGVRPRPGGGYEVDTRRTGAWTGAATHLHRRAGRVLGRHLQHPEAAAPAAGEHAAEDLAPAGLPDPHQLRGHPRRPRAASAARLHRGRRHHLVLAPGREHAHRAVPLRQGQQRHGPAQHPA